MRRPSISIELVEYELPAEAWLYAITAIAAVVVGVVVGLVV